MNSTSFLYSIKFKVILAALSGIILGLAFPNTNFYLLAWICFVPYLLAIEGTDFRQAYVLGLIFGFCALNVGFYWIAEWAKIALGISYPLNLLFPVLYGFCISQAFGLVSSITVYVRASLKVSSTFVFPVIFVSVFSLFPMIFQFKLGDSQTSFQSIIQPVEFTGVYGLDFILLLFNSLVFTLILNFRKWRSISTLMAAGTVVIWIASGIYLQNMWNHEISQWKSRKIGIIQPNREVTLERPKPLKGYSREYPLEMEMSKTLSQEGAEVIIWPEGHFFGYTYWSSVREAFINQAKKLGTHLLFYDATFKEDSGKKTFHNTVFHLSESGMLESQYDKMILVPFSEYSPLKGKVFFLDWILGDYLDNLTPGKSSMVFHMEGMNLIPKICYEPLFPEFVAESVAGVETGGVIVVQSQDGWFGKSSQPEQHLAATLLRAVENRTPLIHVINNGPSSVIDPAGRIVFKAPKFERGGWVVDMPFHRQINGSFYSNYPGLFINCIRTACFLLILFSIARSQLKGFFQKAKP